MQPEQTCQITLVEDVGETDGVQDMFRKVWPAVTDPNPLVLFGFRRFRTSHLLNLRALEHEILEIDHQVFQAGLQLAKPPGRDRLALDHAERDTLASVLDKEKLGRLRSLLLQYGKYGGAVISVTAFRVNPSLTSRFADEALAAFNRVMTMETFALADHQELAEQSNLTREETFRTRLIQVDRPVRNNVRDPIQHWLRKAFRSIWFHTLTPKPKVSNVSQGLSTASTIVPAADNSLENGPGMGTFAAQRRTWGSHQNTARLADAVSRFLFGLLTGICLITPMAVLLGQENDRPAQLTTVSISIVVFSLLVALASRASPQEMMGASAAYAAVLVVFVSTSNVGSAS
jgi:hypothetical protein